LARYIDPTGERFWEISRDGATITRRAGKVGTKGRTQTRTFENTLLARFHYKNFVGFKTHTEKYTREDAAPVPVVEPTHDADEWAVYADALQAKGDPLGELIALRTALDKTTGDTPRTKILAAIAALEQRHPNLYGDVTPALRLFELDWHLGRIRHARLDWIRDGRDQEGGTWFATLGQLLPEVPACYQQGTILKALFECPLARALEGLAISSVGTFDYQYTMLSIVEHAPPTLRSFGIRADRSDRREIALAPMRFPSLVSFDCDRPVGQAALFDITTAQWPALRHLAITASDGDVACRMLLDTKLVDQLSSLVVRGATPNADNEAALRKRAPFLRTE
jgi:predicted DNA-binding WGR domain protein